MARTHDMGGRPAGPIDRSEHQLDDWEALTDALNEMLGARGIRRMEELRRVMEDFEPDEYLNLSYFERRVVGMERTLAEKGLITSEEVDRRVAELEQKWGEP